MRFETRAIRRDRLEAVEDLAPARRILLAHARAVSIGLSDDLLERDWAAAAFVEIEARLARRTAAYVAQRIDEREGVVQAAIEAHAAGRAIDVGGIASERDAAAVVMRHDALVHAIGPLLDHVVHLTARNDRLQLRFDRGFRELRLDRLVLARIDRHPPAARDP